ncbi:hypothetical protein Tco_0531013, partial [Tanacetum coccineum]
IVGTLPIDTVKNPKLSTYLVFSAHSYPTEDTQCSTQTYSSINAITIHTEQQSASYDDGEKENKEEEDYPENIHINSHTPPDLSVTFITEKVFKFNSFFESLGLVPPSSNTKLICTKREDGDVMFIEIVPKDDNSRKEEPESGEKEVEYFDVFPTRSELAYHKYLMCDPIPSIFLRNPIVMEGYPSNLKIPCNIGHVHDISSIIDPRLSQVVLGKPFMEISNMTRDPPEGVVRFTNRNNEIAYKMPHKIEQYDSLSNLEKEHTKSVYLRNEEDKRRGVDKDNEDPSWSTSFKTRRTQKTSSALEVLWKTLFLLYLYMIGTLRLLTWTRLSDSGNHVEDLRAQSLIRQMVHNSKQQAACAPSFDEAELWQGQDIIMSDSEHSTVTYTSVPFPVEDDSDIGSPGVDGPPIMPEDPYAYIIAALLSPPSLTTNLTRGSTSPDNIPWPREPHHLPHWTYSDPEEEPEEDDEDPEEDPADYPADGDDDDDEDEDEDEDEEEEEHPAPADSIPPIHRMTARISIRDEPSISLPPREEVERLLALTTLPPSPLTPLSSPLPQIPSPPLPIPSPPPNSPTHIEILESCLPLRKRVRFASPTPSHEVGESSAAGAARQDGPAIAREDPYSVARGDLYGFVDMVDVAPGHPMSRELDYGITIHRIELHAYATRNGDVPIFRNGCQKACAVARECTVPGRPKCNLELLRALRALSDSLSGSKR